MNNVDLAALIEKYKDFIASLPEELQKKVREASSLEELQGLIGEVEGELPDELAESVAGGKDSDYDRPTMFPCYCKLLANIADVFIYQWAKRGNEVYVVKSSDGSYVAMPPTCREEGRGIRLYDTNALGFLRKA